MAKSSILVKILGDAKGLSGAIGQADAKLGAFGRTAGTTVGGLLSSGMVKAVAAVGGTAAIGGLFKSGISAATEFQSGMNEVFTLLPGISGKAMGSMEGQVKSFSKEFGVLPTATIPALYQSLSAGVPPDNVFKFLETAQKAAKGGVTDLTTSVDGISSVVNAYGNDVIDATKASDLMFTAVRLGKTDFSQLSSSLSNVTPVAAALGVGFEDVTAGLAVLTAQGVPTAQATTQMRAAFAELGKSGSVADKAFSDIAGKSFPQFIAEGGNVQQAFQLMAEGADANGSSLIDMFGSIEAGQAVMALTKGDGEAFAAALGEMNTSAGATDEAFKQMNTGIKPALDKLRANWAVAMVGMGEKLAPFVQAIAEKLPGAMAKVGAAVKSASGPMKSFGSAVGTAFEFLSNNKEIIIGAVAGIVAGLGVWAASAAVTAAANFTLAGSVIALAAPFIAIGAAVAVAVAGLVWAYNNVQWFRTGVDAVVGWLVGTAWPAIQMAFSAIASAAGTAMGWISGKISATVKFLSSLWAQWGSQITAVALFAWNYIKNVIGAALTVITGVWKVFKGLFTGDWSTMWAGIKQVLSGALTYIKTVLSAAWTIIKTVAVTAWNFLKSKAVEIFNSIRDKVAEAAMNTRIRVVNAFTALKDGAIQKAGELVAWVRTLPGKVVSALGNVALTLAFKGRELLNGLWTGAKQKYVELAAWVAGLPGKAKSAIGSTASTLYSVGSDLIQGMVNGITAKAASVASAARKVVSGAISAAKSALKIGSPSKVFDEIGQWTGEGYVEGVQKMTAPANRATTSLVTPPAFTKLTPYRPTTGPTVTGTTATAGDVTMLHVDNYYANDGTSPDQLAFTIRQVVRAA